MAGPFHLCVLLLLLLTAPYFVSPPRKGNWGKVARLLLWQHRLNPDHLLPLLSAFVIGSRYRVCSLLELHTRRHFQILRLTFVTKSSSLVYTLSVSQRPRVPVYCRSSPTTSNCAGPPDSSDTRKTNGDSAHHHIWIPNRPTRTTSHLDTTFERPTLPELSFMSPPSGRISKAIGLPFHHVCSHNNTEESAHEHHTGKHTSITIAVRVTSDGAKIAAAAIIGEETAKCECLA